MEKLPFIELKSKALIKVVPFNAWIVKMVM